MEMSALNPLNYDILTEKTGKTAVQKAGDFQKILEGILKKRKERPAAPSTKLTSRGEGDKLLNVCYELESLFVGSMLKTMRSTVHESEFFGKSIAKDIFNDMLYDEYATLMARSDQFGLARQIYNQLRV